MNLKKNQKLKSRLRYSLRLNDFLDSRKYLKYSKKFVLKRKICIDFQIEDFILFFFTCINSLINRQLLNYKKIYKHHFDSHLKALSDLFSELDLLLLDSIRKASHPLKNHNRNYLSLRISIVYPPLKLIVKYPLEQIQFDE